MFSRIVCLTITLTQPGIKFMYSKHFQILLYLKTLVVSSFHASLYSEKFLFDYKSSIFVAIRPHSFLLIQSEELDFCVGRI